ncbi:MAG: hypothetical protein H6706_08065 [Myxococcales bacterium]|nr:hypothetical protein [Myxococcales bacterium]
MALPDRIRAAVEGAVAGSRRPATEAFIDVLEALGALPGAEDAGWGTHRHLEYETWVGAPEVARRRVHALALVAPLRLALAPVVVGELPAGDGSVVLVTRYAACPGERLRPVLAADVPIGEAAMQRFRREINKMAERGLVHAFTRGAVHWRVSSETGTLVLDAWQALQPGTPAACEEMRQQVDRALDHLRRRVPR